MESKLIDPNRLVSNMAKNARNESGWLAVDDKVIILPDDIGQRTKGGVDLDERFVERQQLAQTRGTLVAMGPNAFKYSIDGRPWEGQKPSEGDRVYFERYAGLIVRGDDARDYRVMDAKMIGAVRDRDATKPEADGVGILT